jgi:hypothetical protein
MRTNAITKTWVSFGLLALAPVVFVVWGVLTTNAISHPIDLRLAAGPGVCLAASLLSLMFAGSRLMGGIRPNESFILVIAVVIATCEAAFFAWWMFAAALGIPAAG